MEPIFIVVSLISIFATLGAVAVAALRWGADSRPSIGDSHAR